MRRAFALGYHIASFSEAIGGLGLHGLGMQIFLEELGWRSAGHSTERKAPSTGSP